MMLNAKIREEHAEPRKSRFIADATITTTLARIAADIGSLLTFLEQGCPGICKWAAVRHHRGAIDIYNHIDRKELRESYLAHIPQLGI
jgi:hypothetical protein